MKDYIVIHGGVKTASGFQGVGSVVSLDENDVKKMDPHGECFVEKAKHDTEAKAKAAGKAAHEAELKKGGK